MSCLYILSINPLLVTSLAQIFSHPVGCLFVLLMVYFAVQKLLILIRSHLFIFASISFSLGDRAKRNIAKIYVRVFCLCFLLEALWFLVLFLYMVLDNFLLEALWFLVLFLYMVLDNFLIAFFYM